MELKLTKTKKILVVFAMIIVRSTLQMETTSPSAIQKVETNLLSMLGMKRKPVIDRKKARISQSLMNLYETTINNEYESTSLPLPGRLTRSANTVRSYSHQESSIDRKFPHDRKFRLNFDLSNYPENEIPTSAELKLTIVPKENRSIDYRYEQVFVNDIVLPGIKGKTKPILRLVDTQIVNTTTDKTTLSLDVLPIVERWLSNHSSNYGLLVDVRSPTGSKTASHVRLKRSIRGDDDDWESVQPLLFVYSDDLNIEKLRIADWTQPKRRKRSSQPKYKRRTRDECRRHQLWVDFEKVGWNDWIVAPPGYDAYYCAGDCPSQFGDHLNASNHAIVQSLVHSVHPFTIPKPCCVPTSLTPISMLYLDEQNKAVLKNYPDMVVDGCGCQ